jgi:glycosyltransferase involved in cell wall biosynthesis
MQRKKIVWITPDAFLDTDAGIVPYIKDFNIHWIILFGKKNRFSESDLNKFRSNNLKITFSYNKSRERYPNTLIYYLKLIRVIKNLKPDIIYFNIIPNNPYIIPLYLWLPKNKTIVTAHDGRVTESMPFSKLIKYSFNLCFRTAKNVNMFSKFQAEYFNKSFPNKNITIIPLAPKNFGKATLDKRTDCIGFVYFGTIHSDKNIDILIEAANQLVEEGINKFKVSINGEWRVNWNIKDRIRHPEVFELNIGNVDNKDIPNLFSYNHFAVYPYKNMSQSGAIKCAFNYNTPVIVSDLKGFTDEVIDGTDGFVFKSEDVADLKKIMKNCIFMKKTEYDLLVDKMKKHIENSYSFIKIINMYNNMFNKIV